MIAQPRRDVGDALGFSSTDRWTTHSSRRWRGSRADRRLTIALRAIGVTLALLVAIQVFMWWFAPCVRGAC